MAVHEAVPAWVNEGRLRPICGPKGTNRSVPLHGQNRWRNRKQRASTAICLSLHPRALRRAKPVESEQNLALLLIPIGVSI